MLGQEHLYDFDPILHEHLHSDLMSVDVVGTKSLHAEVVDEPVSFDAVYVASNHSVRDVFGDESEGYRESVALETPEL